MLHLFFHLLGEFQLVGCLFRTDGEIDRVQSVDTVIALGSLFLAGDFQQLVQAYQFPSLLVTVMWEASKPSRTSSGITYPRRLIKA